MNKRSLLSGNKRFLSLQAGYGVASRVCRSAPASSSASCAPSPRSRSSGVSPGRPTTCTSPSKRSASRSKHSSARSASRCYVTFARECLTPQQQSAWCSKQAGARTLRHENKSAVVAGTLMRCPSDMPSNPCPPGPVRPAYRLNLREVITPQVSGLFRLCGQYRGQSRDSPNAQSKACRILSGEPGSRWQ